MNPFRNTTTDTANKTVESHTDKQVTYAKLLKQFPKIKFSYELKSYKKVSNSNMNINDNTNDKDNVYFWNLIMINKL